MSDHFASPLPAGADAPVGVIFRMPLVCRVCGRRIYKVRRGVAAFRHYKTRGREPGRKEPTP